MMQNEQCVELDSRLLIPLALKPRKPLSAVFLRVVGVHHRRSHRRMGIVGGACYVLAALAGNIHRVLTRKFHVTAALVIHDLFAGKCFHGSQSFLR